MKMLAMADTNGDKAVTKAEFRTAAEARFAKADTNSDGTISADENFYATRDEFTAAVAAGKYPFPPARVLYLVTKGEPNPEIAAFYRWVLTDGQQFVQPAGYVALTQDKIDEALGKLPK